MKKPQTFKIIALLFFANLPLPSTAQNGTEPWHSQLVANNVVEFESQFDTKVRPFIQKIEHRGTFVGENANTLTYATYIHPQEKGAIVLVNGRGTSFLHDGEMAYDLYQSGYSVYAYDHRGQGHSSRLLTDSSLLGYVDHFANYEKDLRRFVREVVRPETHSKNFAIGTSMGGAILLRAQSDLPEGDSNALHFDATAYLAPMIGINTSPYPEWLAYWVTGLGDPKATMGNDANTYTRDSFTDSNLTGNIPRFERFEAAYNEEPVIRMTSATKQWIHEALGASRALMSRVEQPKRWQGLGPMVIFRGLLDRVVRNDMMSDFCDAITSLQHSCLVVDLADAHHGVMLESNFIRDQVLGQIQMLFEGQGQSAH